MDKKVVDSTCEKMNEVDLDRNIIEGQTRCMSLEISPDEISQGA
jgi:hypothetical protein